MKPNLIKLTHEYGYPIMVNPNYIASIAPYDYGGSVVCIGNDRKPIIVMESPKDIIEEITALYGVD